MNRPKFEIGDMVGSDLIAYIAEQEQQIKEQEEDMRKIKVIMSSDTMKSGVMDSIYEFTFYDEELTRINWVKQALK